MSHDNSTSEPLHLLQFPDIIIEQIMGNFSYHEIATLRIVCQRFNDVNKRLLNRGFHAAEHFHLKCQKEVKGELPRRESERRDHPLAHHCNILSGIETRLSLLNMTFLKYIDAKFCCFIPGKVIDELFRVLKFVQSTKNVFLKGSASNDAKNNILKELRANVILKELRDISSMAMEHFEENILPGFKAASTTPLLSFAISSPQHFNNSLSTYDSSPVSSTSLRAIELPGMSSPGLSDDSVNINNLKSSSKENKNDINVLKKQVVVLQTKLSDSRRKISEQEQVVLELNRVLSEQMSKLGDHESKLVEINRTLAENDGKVAAFFNMIGSEISAHPVKSNEATLNNDSNLGSSAIKQAFHQLAAYFLRSEVFQPALTSTQASSSIPTCNDSNISSNSSKETPKDGEVKLKKTTKESNEESVSNNVPLTRNTRKRKARNESVDCEKKDCKSKKIR